MPVIALQDVLIPHSELVRDLKACADAGINPVTFGLIPFSDEITSDCDIHVNAVPFGSVKLVRLWQQRKTPKAWRVFYDEERFDQRTWAKAIGDTALNGPLKMRETVLGAVKDTKWSEPVFVKPANDLKAFAGMVVNTGETIAQRLAEGTQDSSLQDDQPIIWAPRQEIECEFRCWMHDDYMIEASRYKTGQKADHRPVSEDERLMLANKTAQIASWFTPHMFYVVDIAVMLNGDKRVVEYNCFNCSGRYAADRAKIFKAVL